ncbi:MAG: hypothetical protein HFE63_05285 [Clostridiales bacterium]|nr:hypothetical protein [Clostridiales bacterium]
MKKIFSLILSATLTAGIVGSFALPTLAHEDCCPGDHGSLDGLVLTYTIPSLQSSTIVGTLSLAADKRCYFSPGNVDGTYIQHGYGTHNNIESSWGEYDWSRYYTFNGHDHTGELTVTNISHGKGRFVCIDDGCKGGISMHRWECPASGYATGNYLYC